MPVSRLSAPADVRRRAAELMVDRTHLGYTETFGIRPLRREIAAHYRRWYSLMSMKIRSR